MTDYQRMIIQRKLYHLQTLAGLNIQCITAAFDSIKDLDIADANYNSAALAALSSLEAVTNVSEVDDVFIEQAKQALRRIVEFTDSSFQVVNNAEGGIVYPSWPPAR